MTSFQKRVYQVVSKIARGRIMTYQQVACSAGRPKAYRAVGNILNKNRDSKVPCHRVIRSDGQLGGYSKGLCKKKLLLRQEGVIIE